jgi:molybdopterin-guanine dinucleotide biosynthesis protein A
MTGVILAGGKASRFKGVQKSFLEVGGEKIISTQMKLFSRLFDEVIIISNDCAKYLEYDAVIVNDIIRDKGPLGGIYTALYYMKSDSCFVAACDMPFLNEALISYMIDNTGKDWIYTIKNKDRYEPLHTIYKKQCIKSVKRMIDEDELKILPLFTELRAKVVPDDVINRLDPVNRSFRNINSEEDLQEIT